MDMKNTASVGVNGISQNSSRILPDYLKISPITPLHKSASDPLDWSNYGGLSILPNISKTVEKAIANRCKVLVYFIKKYNKIHNCQNCYMEKRSLTRLCFSWTVLVTVMRLLDCF